MNKKNITTLIGVAVVVGALGFFGGMKYGQSKALSPKSLQNLTQAQRQQLFAGGRSGAGAGAGGGFAGRGGAGGGNVSGQVLSKDDKSITVKMRDGSSKIVFYSGTTAIGKSTAGTPADLSVNQQVTVNGNTNSDGSVTAQNIQIRPDMPAASPTNQ